MSFKAMIVDEAHRLKNKDSKFYSVLSGYHFDFCVLLTGTPVQNNVEELWSLLHFIDAEHFADLKSFEAKYGSITGMEQVDQLRDLLGSHVLRRLKRDVETELKARSEMIIYVELTKFQKSFYRAVFEKNVEILFEKTRKVKSLRNIAINLRKVCNHPYMIPGSEDAELVRQNIRLPTPPPSPADGSKPEQNGGNTENGGKKAAEHDNFSDEVMNHLTRCSGKFILLDKLLPKLKKEGHKVLIYSQFTSLLDILEDWVRWKKYGYERIDGSVIGTDRQESIDRFGQNSEKFAFLLSTRAGGVGINLTSADTVIIFDSDWNPQNDIQAQSRCHRIGQTKHVQVYRLITRDSYEMHMFQRASEKLLLDNLVLHSIHRKSKDKTLQLEKKELEDMLKKGALYALKDDATSDKKTKEFCEADIDTLLSKGVVVQVEANQSILQNSALAQATFVPRRKRKVTKQVDTDIEMTVEEDIEEDLVKLDDPKFWEKLGFKKSKPVTTDNELTVGLTGIVSGKRRRTRPKPNYVTEQMLDDYFSDLTEQSSDDARTGAAAENEGSDSEYSGLEDAKNFTESSEEYFYGSEDYDAGEMLDRARPTANAKPSYLGKAHKRHSHQITLATTNGKPTANTALSVANLAGNPPLYTINAPNIALPSQPKGSVVIVANRRGPGRPPKNTLPNVVTIPDSSPKTSKKKKSKKKNKEKEKEKKKKKKHKKANSNSNSVTPIHVSNNPYGDLSHMPYRETALYQVNTINIDNLENRKGELATAEFIVGEWRWRVLVYPFGRNNPQCTIPNHYMSVFLHCLGRRDGVFAPDQFIKTEFRCTIHSTLGDAHNIFAELEHKFTVSDPLRGFEQFMPLPILFRTPYYLFDTADKQQHMVILKTELWCFHKIAAPHTNAPPSAIHVLPNQAAPTTATTTAPGAQPSMVVIRQPTAALGPSATLAGALPPGSLPASHGSTQHASSQNSPNSRIVIDLCDEDNSNGNGSATAPPTDPPSADTVTTTAATAAATPDTNTDSKAFGNDTQIVNVPLGEEDAVGDVPMPALEPDHTTQGTPVSGKRTVSTTTPVSPPPPPTVTSAAAVVTASVVAIPTKTDAAPTESSATVDTRPQSIVLDEEATTVTEGDDEEKNESNSAVATAVVASAPLPTITIDPSNNGDDTDTIVSASKIPNNCEIISLVDSDGDEPMADVTPIDTVIAQPPPPPSQPQSSTNDELPSTPPSVATEATQQSAVAVDDCSEAAIESDVGTTSIQSQSDPESIEIIDTANDSSAVDVTIESDPPQPTNATDDTNNSNTQISEDISMTNNTEADTTSVTVNENKEKDCESS